MKKVKLSVSAFAELCAYVQHCCNIEISVENGMLLKFLEFHLASLWEKLHRKSVDVQYRGQQVVRLAFNEGELLTFSWLFKQVPTGGRMLGIEGMLLEGL